MDAASLPWPARWVISLDTASASRRRVPSFSAHPADTDYIYFPMPYEKSARIELVSERTSGPPIDLQADVTFATVAKATDEGKFYALWRRENPTREGAPFTYLKTQGRGKVVGNILQAQGLKTGTTEFFEGR